MFCCITLATICHLYRRKLNIAAINDWLSTNHDLSPKVFKRFVFKPFDNNSWLKDHYFCLYLPCFVCLLSRNRLTYCWKSIQILRILYWSGHMTKLKATIDNYDCPFFLDINYELFLCLVGVLWWSCND